MSRMIKKYLEEERPATYEQLKLNNKLAVTIIKISPLLAISSIKKPSEKMMNRIDDLLYQGNQIVERIEELEPQFKIEKEAARMRHEAYKAERLARKGK